MKKKLLLLVLVSGSVFASANDSIPAAQKVDSRQAVSSDSCNRRCFFRCNPGMPVTKQIMQLKEQENASFHAGDVMTKKNRK